MQLSRAEWIGARRDVVWIARYLAEPEAFAPGVDMPDYNHLSEAQRLMIGEFLVSLAARQGR